MTEKYKKIIENVIKFKQRTKCNIFNFQKNELNHPKQAIFKDKMKYNEFT